MKQKGRNENTSNFLLGTHTDNSYAFSKAVPLFRMGEGDIQKLGNHEMIIS